MNGNQLAEMQFRLAPADDPTKTLLTADLDLDKAAIAKLTHRPDLAGMPDSLINFGLASMVDEIATSIEAGKPLGSFASYGSKLRPGQPSLSEVRYEAAMNRTAAAAPQTQADPMASAKPMIDPNRAAQDFLHAKR